MHGFIVEPFDLGGQVELFVIYNVACRDVAVQDEYVAGARTRQCRRMS